MCVSVYTVVLFVSVSRLVQHVTFFCFCIHFSIGSSHTVHLTAIWHRSLHLASGPFHSPYIIVCECLHVFIKVI